jgi:hypothetical protein
MREQLIRYLLGELDADERRDLQSRLKSSPELRAELEQLRSCFAASQEEDLFAPEAPSGLAARTAGRVTGGEYASGLLGARQGAELSHAGDPPSGILGWSLADLTVAGGVMLAVSMLIFPALRNSRDGTRRTVCQDHQQQLYVLVTRYAQDHRGLFPEVGPKENAGIFTIRLIGSGYIGPEELAQLLVCPGAPLADKFRSGELKIQLPSAEAIRVMSHAEKARVASTSSPFFNYRLPYRVGHTYHFIRNEHQPMSPLFSDASGDEQCNPMSPNHGGAIVQVQCADGSLRSLTSCSLPGFDPDMYHNDLGQVAAGLGPLDTVLGPSDAMPGDDGSEQVK